MAKSVHVTINYMFINGKIFVRNHFGNEYIQWKGTEERPAPRLALRLPRIEAVNNTVTVYLN
jgi:hypothetical protein